MSTDRVTFILNHVVNELNKHADRILRREFGLTYSQFLFLLHLNASGPVPSGALATQMGVSRAAVSKRMSWFASRGLITSGGDRSDSRVVTLAITPAGWRLVTDMSDVLENEFRVRFHELHDVDLDALNTTLLKVLAHLQTPVVERTPPS
jgi:DNA-binding MarR family transcriptional regulator